MGDALEQETLHLLERYARDVVEAFNICPWAADVRRSGKLYREVLRCTSREEAVREASDYVEVVARRGDVDVALLAFPLWNVGKRDFRAFVSELEQAHVRESRTAVVAMADFHPCAEANVSSPAKLIPFLRRAPVPVVQVVKVSALARARGSDGDGSTFAAPAAILTGGLPQRPTVSESIARANLRTVERVGPKTLERVYQELESIRAGACQRWRDASANDPDDSGR